MYNYDDIGDGLVMIFELLDPLNTRSQEIAIKLDSAETDSELKNAVREAICLLKEKGVNVKTVEDRLKGWI